MNIVAQSGNDAFIVELNNNYYLVNLYTNRATLAEPPNTPDMFLRFGYWEDVDGEVDKVRIEKIIKNQTNLKP